MNISQSRLVYQRLHKIGTRSFPTWYIEEGKNALLRVSQIKVSSVARSVGKWWKDLRTRVVNPSQCYSTL